MAGVDATRIAKVEVMVTFPFVQKSVGNDTMAATLREKDARDLMHALAAALGYTATPK